MMKTELVENLVTNSHDKSEYVIYTKNLKLGLNHRLVLKKFHRAVKFDQNTWLKSYINMNTDLRKKNKK